MARHNLNVTTISEILEHLNENGFDGMAHAVEILLNEAMKLERAEFLGAGPYERSAERQGYANGFKSKRIKTRMGELDVAVPKVRGLEEGSEPFYPNALERGLRSERALTLAVAEMYVQGISTRKVTKVVEEMCGLQISSQQVSRAAKLLDEELELWRNRPLAEHPYVILDATYAKVRHGGQVPVNSGASRGRSQRRRQAFNHRSQHVALGSRSALARVFKKLDEARTHGSSSVYERQPRRPEGRPQGRLSWRALATVPVPFAAERIELRAQGRYAQESRERYQGHLQRRRRTSSGAAIEEDGGGLSRIGAASRDVDGEQHPGRTHSVRTAAQSSLSTANLKRHREAEQGTEAANARCVAVSE